MTQDITSRLEQNPLEGWALKYMKHNYFTRFYGFVKYNNYRVIALQESSWYLALFKPYYKRLLLFQGFKPEVHYKHSRRQGRKARMQKLFNSKLTVSKVKQSMHLIDDLKDDTWIDKFIAFYGGE